MKPEKANVYLTKVISEYETQVINTVNYNDDPKLMILDAIMQESHNHDEEDKTEIMEFLEDHDFEYFEDGWEIVLWPNYIEPFTEKEIDKDMFLIIKYPTI